MLELLTVVRWLLSSVLKSHGFGADLIVHMNAMDYLSAHSGVAQPTLLSCTLYSKLPIQTRCNFSTYSVGHNSGIICHNAFGSPFPSSSTNTIAWGYTAEERGYFTAFTNESDNLLP